MSYWHYFYLITVVLYTKTLFAPRQNLRCAQWTHEIGSKKADWKRGSWAYDGFPYYGKTSREKNYDDVSKKSYRDCCSHCRQHTALSPFDCEKLCSHLHI